jgi:hypothetical protein
MDELKQAAIELAWILSVPALAACVLWGANELYYRSFGRHKARAILTTGLVGTPIHELAHAITAMVFGMKVTEVVFFRPDPVSQTLGYVNYRYNPANIVHRIGMVFTGLAPLLFGAYLVYLLFALAEVPNLHTFFLLTDYRSLSGGDALTAVGEWGIALFASLNTWQTIMAALLAVMIGAHSTPSKADLKGSLRGAAAVLAILLAYWSVMKMLPSQPELLIGKSIEALNHVSTAILQLALISSLFALLLSATGFAFNKIIWRREANPPVQEEKSGNPLELSKMG